MEFIFEWNDIKSKQNLKKHKISFEEAKTVFNDPMSITFLDEHHSAIEERYLSIGLSANKKVLFVVHTEREEKKNICGTYN